MLNRRLVAFRSNAKKLCGLTGRLYLWTFTLPVKMHPKEASKAWSALLRRLRRWVPDWTGIRVFERHPGKSALQCFFPEGQVDDSHGMHVHFLATRYYWVEEIRAACRASGWGRVHVVRVKGDSAERMKAAEYLAKYLCKKRHPDLAGLRLVGYVGYKDATRLKDVESTGWHCDLWSAAKEIPGWNALNFFGRMHAVQWLNLRCLVEGGSPVENVMEMVQGQICGRQREKMNRGAMHDPGRGRDILDLLDLGIFEHDDIVRNQRFIPKARRLPVPPASPFAHSLS